MAVREPCLRPRGLTWRRRATSRETGCPRACSGTWTARSSTPSRTGSWRSTSSWRRTVASGSDALAHQLVGNALEVSAQVIIDHTGIPLAVPQVVDALLIRVIEQVRGSVPWRPGARELLEELKESGVPNVLVTMSWRNLASTIVESLPAGLVRAPRDGGRGDAGQAASRAVPARRAADRG